MPASKTGRHTGGRCVLAVRFSALGDVAMAVGPLYDACRSNPDVRFVFLTKAPTARLLLEPPSNLTVVGADMKHDYKGTSGMIRLLRQLRRDHGFTDLADLHDVLRTRLAAIFCRMHGIRVSRIRKGRREKARLVADRSENPAPIATTDRRYRDVFERLGLRLSGATVRFFDGGADHSAFESAAPDKAEGEKWIGIAPFAAHMAKIYPAEKMKRVIGTLSEDPSVRIFLFGGGDEEKRILGLWSEEFPRVTSMARQRFGFSVEMALMSRLDAMIAMDSGNMHLAALAGVPTVTVWGSTHPSMGFTPSGFDQSLAVQTPMECRPCSVFGNRPCRTADYRCLTSIDPEEIISRVRKIISK